MNELTLMKAAILGLIETRDGGVTCVELCKKIQGFTGEYSWEYGQDNIVLWDGVSSAAIDAVNLLMKEKKIIAYQSTLLVYVIDGATLLLPIAKNPTRKYKKPHWFPVVFWTYEQLAKLPPDKGKVVTI